MNKTECNNNPYSYMERNSSGKKLISKINKIFIMLNRHKPKGRNKTGKGIGNFERERGRYGQTGVK